MPRIPRRWKAADQAPPPVQPHPADATEPAPPPPAVAADDAALAPADATITMGAVPVPEATPAPEPEGDASTTIPAAEPASDAVVVEQAPLDATPRFRERTRMRRRLRFLRRRRELAFRDLGGLVFDLHRFGRERTDLVAQKVEALGLLDGELRTLETALDDRTELTELREPGIAACPRCQTLHDTDANFCPGCGMSLRGATIRDASAVTVTPAGDEAAVAPSDPPQQPAPHAS